MTAKLVPSPETLTMAAAELPPGSDSLDHYRAALSRYPLLDRDTEVALARRMDRVCRVLLQLIARHPQLLALLIEELEPGLQQEQPFRSDIDAAGLALLRQRETRRHSRRRLLRDLRVSRAIVLRIAGHGQEIDPAPCPPLWQQRLRTLWIQVQDARQRLIQANLRLVLHIAAGFSGHAYGLRDLIQEGNLGLIKAVDLYDAERGFRFSTYAYAWIRVSIQNGLMDRGHAVRMPHHVHEQINRLWRCRSQHERRYGQTPDTVTLARDSGFDIERVRRLGQLGNRTVSLQQPAHPSMEEDGEEWLADEQAADSIDIIQNAEIRQRLAALIAQLEPRLRRIVILRHGLEGVEPQTCEQVGLALGLSRERVRQLEIIALEQLRELGRTQHPDHLQLHA